MHRLGFLVACAGLAAATSLQAAPISFAEEFALARDRTAALKKLIPGTEDYYYYHCLNFLNEGQFEKAASLFTNWFQRFNQTPRLTEMQTRHALLNYEKDPQRSLAYFKVHLGLDFSHQRVTTGGAPDLPTVLDQKVIAKNTLADYSRQRWQAGGDNYEDAALDWLLTQKIDENLRRHLLSRLHRPDIAGLAKLVADDLNHQHSGGFGSFAIHRQLTLGQLEELAKWKPDLLQNQNFVHTWIAKLHPGDDEDWRRDRSLTKAYLDRLLAFTRRLSPAFNPLKAHVLFHRLVLDQSLGQENKALFVEYLQLPRFQGYMSRAMLEQERWRSQPADLNANFQGVTLLGIVGNDEPLVRHYLKRFLVDAESAKEYEPFINDGYLQQAFAETKIENGLGDAETWAAQLSPEAFRQIKERIDIDFAPTSKTEFGADEAVKLELFVKNVPSLMVKVFEVNGSNFYRTQKREVDTAINLDGLVPNWEQSLTFSETPFRRVPRQFDFAQLNKPGVYVIDFIGGGKSSRALIRKGRLRALSENGSAGLKLTVIDDAGQRVPEAVVWLGGHEYKADARGVAQVPYSTTPGQQPIVLSKGDFSSLDFVHHAGEQYMLQAGIHVDRESLLSHREASILVRPSLRLNGSPVSINLLEDARLVVTAADQDGIGSSTDVPNFKLFEDRESVYPFRVTPRLASLTVTLSGKVKNLSQGKDIELSASQTFTVNGIDATDKIEDLHLANFGGDYVIEVLGRTGEFKVDRPVHVSLKHREFREPVSVLLKSDAAGRVTLGKLADIVSVTATGPEGTAHTWALPFAQHSYGHTIHARAGEPLALPYVGLAEKIQRSDVALFEMRGPMIKADRFDALSLSDGTLEIAALSPGDYDLLLKVTGERIRICVVAGSSQAGYVLGSQRYLQLPPLKPVQIAGISVDDEAVTIRLRDFTEFTRLHVCGTRYLPAFSGYVNLGHVSDASLQGISPRQADSLYLSGRDIGDEYRYVLDRRQQKRFPGNMLERPALLLNPWVVQSTQTEEQLARAGGEYRKLLNEAGGGAYAPAASAPRAPGMEIPRPGAAAGGFENLDFLRDQSATLWNLVPNKDGLVRVPRGELGPHAMIQVLAVDPLHTTARLFNLAEQKAAFVDLRLRNGLEPRSHFTQQKQVSVLQPGKRLVLADVNASRFEVYDSLPKVYGLYTTLSHDPKLAEFAFILNWPTMKLDEKKTQYSKYACHELNFFLFKKDPAFFQAVVKPYLANKKDKTFLDHWLLDHDLREYLHPWQYSRLNAAERVLLSQRLKGEQARAAQHLNDLLRLAPRQPERDAVYFESGLNALMLQTTDTFGRPPEGRAVLAGLGTINSPAAAAAEPQQAGMSPPTDSPRSGANRGLELRREGDGAKLKSAEKDAGRLDSMNDEAATADSESAKETEQLRERTFFSFDRGDKKAPGRFYRKVDLTQELAENNYYKLPIAQQTDKLVGVNAFWLDYARSDLATAFLSQNLAEASHNFTEMMLALAVLDLPFTAGKHQVEYVDGKMLFTPANVAVAFHEEVKPAGALSDKVQILVSQNFYRNGDRFKEENGERFDKFVTDEFVMHTVYGCQVVVTNPTSSVQRLSVLLQVPTGAIPLSKGRYTRTVSLELEPYRTQVLDYFFYFPKPGQYEHFPVHVARGESLVAAAAPFHFNVVEKPSRLDTDSWDYVSQNGSPEQVLAMLERENIQALDLGKIAFRMRDKAFFQSALALISARHAYQPTLWSYSFHHNDPASIKEFLAHVDQVVNECGGPIDSALLTVDPVERFAYEHLEYKPLINARAHALGHAREIVNPRLHRQYEALMKCLGYRPRLTDSDQLAVAYYLLLQDRVEEALGFFGNVNPANLATTLQYDYCAAYLDMFNDDPHKVRSIIAKYRDYPVERWRNAFVAIANQLDEWDGKGPKVADKDDPAEQQAALAAKEPSFEIGVAGKTVNLTWKNIETVRVNYYLMDVELLFSRNPFVQQSASQFSQIRPNETKEYKLPNFQNKLAIPLPENLADKNVLVGVVANGKTRSAPVLANAMHATLNENYGQLQITDAVNGRPLSKVYVKTYVRLQDGSVKFHKDGYTDQRGKFDYATVSTPERSPVARFGILVLSDSQGALIRDVPPPQQ